MAKWWRILAIGGLVGATACASVMSRQSISRAEVELRAAETAGAAEQANYEHAMATAYLTKAYEEEGEAEYEAAKHLADKALGWAKVARQKAEALRAAGAPQLTPSTRTATRAL